MPASKKYLPPEALRRISRLDLRARQIVEGFLAGMHRSPYFGQSIEFLQHREYVPGDDLRHVDWQVWARQDRLYVKQFEEDTNFRCTLLIDNSASMEYGSGPLNKLEYAKTIAACLAYLVLRKQDSVGCLTFADTIRRRVPSRSKRNHLHAILNSLEETQPADKTDLSAVFRKAAEETPKRGMVVVVSDLFGDPAGTLRGLRQLKQCQHDLLVFHVLDDDELDFPFRGATRFEGLESLQHLNCNPRALRDGYLKALQDYLATIRHGCARDAVDYALVRTSDSLDAVLAKFLTKRLEVSRKH